MRDISKICKNAKCEKLIRGEAIFCKSCLGKTYEAPLLERGAVCVATTFYSSGHLNYEVDVDLKKMKTCPNRKL